jgi:hypothetical protein
VKTRLPWAVFGLMVLWNLGFVGRYGANIPRSDEWQDVAVLLGNEPFTPGWLWRPHSVHRIPLPRLVRLVLYRATGDFRAPLFFNVAVMALAAAMLLRALARARGPSGLDVVVPLLLLGPGHYMNFLWGFQVQFALSCALFVGTLAVLVTSASAPGPRTLAALGALVLAQVLTGANGVALAVPLLGWLAAAVTRSRAEGGTLRATGLALACVSAVLVAVYPIGLRGPAASPPSTAAAVAATALQFLSTSLGATVPLWQGRALVVAVLAAATLMVLGRAWRRDPAQRWRASGLAAGWGSVLLLAVFVGLGRAELTLHPGIQDRYLTLAMPTLILGYVGFSLYGGATARRVVPAGLLGATLLSMAVSGPQALGYGEFRRAQLDALRRDVDRGLPLEAIAARNASAIFQYSTGVEAHLRRLLDRGAWPFEGYRPDPRLRQEFVRVPAALEAFDVRDLRRDGRGYAPSGPAPRLLLRLPRPHALAGVELRYTLDGPPGRLLRLEMRWAVSGNATPVFPLSGPRASFPIRGQATPRTLTVWVYDTVDTLALDPDRLARSFTLHGAVLLELPADWMAASVQRVPGAAVADGGAAGLAFAGTLNSFRRWTSSR